MVIWTPIHHAHGDYQQSIFTNWAILPHRSDINSQMLSMLQRCHHVKVWLYNSELWKHRKNKSILVLINFQIQLKHTFLLLDTVYLSYNILIEILWLCRLALHLFREYIGELISHLAHQWCVKINGIWSCRFSFKVNFSIRLITAISNSRRHADHPGS